MMIATSQQAPLVDFTDEALEKVKAKVKEKGVNGVRFGLTGGGCAGFSYEFDYADKGKEEDKLFLTTLRPFLGLAHLSKIF